MTDLPPEARQAVPLRPNESIINAWEGAGESDKGTLNQYLVLTNFRAVIVEEEGQLKGSIRVKWVVEGYRIVLDRDLRAIPPPRHTKYEEGTQFEDEAVLIGGRVWRPHDSDSVDGIVDEIVYARSRVIPPDAPATPSGGGGGQPSVKEVIREVIKVRCRYCGALNLESDAKCVSCGAPLSGR